VDFDITDKLPMRYAGFDTYCRKKAGYNGNIHKVFSIPMKLVRLREMYLNEACS
jgi:hypothetical protein